MSEGGRLDALAAAVADGSAIDWDAVTAGADPSVRAVVQNLRLLSTIAGEHRQVQSDGAPSRFAGASWAHLRIIGHIGSGAFGDVFRAWDSQLEREVALKLVPAESPTALRTGALGEARLLARIRHPDVVTVYGAATQDGYAGLWMELIEGRTLRQMVEADGPFGPHETVTTGLALCRALGAIHAAGLVHGDVKAQNVIRERGGRIVLMDLGAARLLAPVDPEPRAVAATPLYVAPEVLAGGRPDVRSDVYSLGVVLFYLLTGGFTHRDPDAPEAAATQTTDNDHALRQHRNDLPDALVSVVERCLAADPHARFEQAAAVERALAGCLTAQVTPAHARSPVRRWHALAGALLLIVLGGLAGWRLTAGSPATSPVVRLHSMVNLSPPAAKNLGPWVAMSRTGRWIAYRGNDGHLYVRPADGLTSAQVPRSQNGEYPFFSPDENRLGYFADGTLRTHSLADGTNAAVTAVPNTRGATWTADDWIVYTPAMHSALWRVRPSGGPPEQLTTLQPGQTSHRWPAALPDGRIALTVWPSYGDIRAAKIVITDPASGESWTVDHGTRPQYAAAGVLTYAREGEVLATRYDPRRPHATGPGVLLQTGVLTDEQTGYVDYGISNVSLLYIQGGSTSERRRLVWVDETGAAEPLPIPIRAIERPRIAPDGRQIAFVCRERQTDLYHYDLERSVLTRLTSDASAEHEAPVWSPDSTRLAFSRWTFGALRAIVIRTPDTTRHAEVIATSPTHDHVSAWTEQEGLLVTAFNEIGLGDIHRLEARADGRREPVLVTKANERDAQLSPDSHWMLFTSDDSGTDEVYVRERLGSRRIQVSSAGGFEPTWAPDGRAIFYRTLDSMMKVRWPLLGSASEPRALFKDPYARSARRELNYAVMPDGSRFLMVETLTPPDRPLHLFVGWHDDLAPRLTRAGVH